MTTTPKGKSEMYVTQGTVQLELNSENKAIVIINPVQGFNIKCVDKDYIVFVPEVALDHGSEAQVFKKTQRFKTDKLHIINLLTEAAFKRTTIEIKIKKEDFSKPMDIEIVSIKIPATV